MSLKWVPVRRDDEVVEGIQYLIDIDVNARFPVACLHWRDEIWQYFRVGATTTSPLSTDLEEAKAIALVRYRLEK